MVRASRIVAVGLAAAAGLAWCGAERGLAQAPAALRADDPLPTDPRLVQGVLPNGMRYIVMKHAVPPGRAALWLHVSTGSLNETDKQRGIAHFLEHMAFNGSANFPAGTVVDFFQSLGLQFGRHSNASTSFDHTNYKLIMPGNKPDMVEKGLLFLSDVAFRLQLSQEEIDAERQVILEEKRGRNSAMQRVQEQWLKKLAPGSIFGERLPIGVEETILGVNRQDFVDFYGAWYVPSNMVVCMVADMDERAMADLITKHFSQGEPKARPKDQDVGVRASAEDRAIIATDPELTRAQVEITKVEPPQGPVTTVGRLREQLVQQIGVIAFNRRMNKKVSRGGASFLSGGASAGTMMHAVRLTRTSAGGEPGRWKEMLVELALETQRARLHGFDPAEVQDAVKEIVSGAEEAVQTEATRDAGQILQMWDQNLAAEEPISSAGQDLELVRRLTAEITPAEISAAFAKTWEPKGVTFVLQMPSGAGVPTEAELVAIGREALKATPPAETAAARPTALMQKLPEAGKIAATSEHAATGVKTWTLSNGATVHHRFMDYRKNNAVITITLAGGELLETAANRGVTDAAVVAISSKKAAGPFSSSDIQDLMVGKKVDVKGFRQPDAIAISVEGTPEDLEPGMQLAHLLLTGPRLEQAAFDQWKTQQLLQIEQRKFSPSGVATRLFAKAVYGAGEVRTQPLTEAQVNAVTLPAAQAWLDRLTAQSPIEVTVVGDITEERAAELATRYVGSLGARPAIGPATYASLRELRRPPAPRREAATVKTNSDKAQVFSGFYGTDLGNVKDGRLLSAASQILSTRMNREIREKEQLVYGIITSSQPSTVFPGFGMVMAGASTAPDKAERLAARIREMFADFARTGPTDDELTTVKTQIANLLDERMKAPDFWVRKTQSMIYKGQSLDDVMSEPAAYQEMTAEQIRACFARYFKDDTVFEVVVKPDPAGAPAGPGGGGW